MPEVLGQELLQKKVFWNNYLQVNIYQKRQLDHKSPRNRGRSANVGPAPRIILWLTSQQGPGRRAR